MRRRENSLSRGDPLNSKQLPSFPTLAHTASQVSLYFWSAARTQSTKAWLLLLVWSAKTWLSLWVWLAGRDTSTFGSERGKTKYTRYSAATCGYNHNAITSKAHEIIILR